MCVRNSGYCGYRGYQLAHPFCASARGCVEVVEVADIISLYRKFDLYFPLRDFLYIDLHDFHTYGENPVYSRFFVLLMQRAAILPSQGLCSIRKLRSNGLV